MKDAEVAASLFKEGYNCAQALLVVYGPELGIDGMTAFRIASAFGGGMGQMGETCGAVTGAFMLIGLKHGGKGAGDKETKAKINRLVKGFVERFKARHGSIECRELLGCEPSSLKRMEPAFRKELKKKCSIYVQDAAEIIKEMCK